MAREKNPCKKERKVDDPYEIWKGYGQAEGWEWRVLAKTQAPTNETKNPHSTWFCGVKSPFTYEHFELGSVYAREVKESAVQVQ